MVCGASACASRVSYEVFMRACEVRVVLCGSPHGGSLGHVRCGYYALFDGHAGRFAADYCAEKLHVNIASKIETPTDNENVRKCIMEGFKDTDHGFLTLAASKSYKDGCTAVTATLIRDILFIAWVRSVLPRLTRSHRTPSPPKRRQGSRCPWGRRPPVRGGA